MNKKVSFTLPPLGPQHAKQSMDKGMQQVQNPVTKEEVTQKVNELVEKSGLPPSLLTQIGKLAEQAVKSKKGYKKFVDFMVSKKLETRESLKKPNYQQLGSLAVIGKITESMPDPQPVAGPAVPTEGL